MSTFHGVHENQGGTAEVLPEDLRVMDQVCVRVRVCCTCTHVMALTLVSLVFFFFWGCISDRAGGPGRVRMCRRRE